jgi:O-antigen/teichoic acid export membrane protein
MRANTSWAFAGDAVYAGCQWVVLVLLIKALSPAQVGAYAYALAITSPVFVLASVRLRNLLVTSGAPTNDFRDYLTTRLVTTVCALIGSLAIGALSTSTREALIIVALVALARSCDAVSDICHGLFQNALDMRTAAIGLMLNGAVSVLLVQSALVLWHSLPLAAVAYAVGSAVPLFAWNLPRVAGMLKSRREVSDARNNWSEVRSLLMRALPLGLSSAVGSIQTNLPRYAIAALLGPAPLAVFVATSHIPLLGHLVVNAATQAALPLLADDARTRHSSYQARLYGLVASSVAFGSFALLLTIVAGRSVLGVIYGPRRGSRSPVADGDRGHHVHIGVSRRNDGASRLGRSSRSAPPLWLSWRVVGRRAASLPRRRLGF